ncbi:hypothetical protein [Chryseobacterium herbae]|uniref:Uncharacterized protein n=1 Tax=Chryseobacterium herbae TaxID=2976476 RepID=A0ABT2ISL4_9FLAO|nr:hypothetical protein [Chryseobacterium sp. pc1-10]MCT2561818.1 hypothetical protein [Chryseobacterium sp. pc1-10]
MKLTDLVGEIEQGKTAQYLLNNAIDIEYDLIEIYAKEKLNLNSEIEFLNADEIPNDILINIKGIEYENICPLNMLEDMVNDFMIQNPQIDTFELTNQILNYLQNDA